MPIWCEQQRVAVRLRLRDPAGAEIAAGARRILHQDLLPRSLLMASATSRVTASVGPPAENGTMMVIGRPG